MGSIHTARTCITGQSRIRDNYIWKQHHNTVLRSDRLKRCQIPPICWCQYFVYPAGANGEPICQHNRILYSHNQPSLFILRAGRRRRASRCSSVAFLHSALSCPCYRRILFGKDRRLQNAQRVLWVMVVFSGNKETATPNDAMSSSDSAEDDFRKPALPISNLNLGKAIHTLNALQQEVKMAVHRLL